MTWSLSNTQEREYNASASRQIRLHKAKSNFQEVKIHNWKPACDLLVQKMTAVSAFVNSTAYYCLSGWRSQHSRIMWNPSGNSNATTVCSNRSCGIKYHSKDQLKAGKNSEKLYRILHQGGCKEGRQQSGTNMSWHKFTAHMFSWYLQICQTMKTTLESKRL